MSPASYSSRSAAWGVRGSSDSSLKSFALVALVALVLGLFGGYTLRAATHSGPSTSKNLKANAVLDPLIGGVVSAPQTQDGAVKAATSLVTGLPFLALENEARQTSTLNDLLAPNADPRVVQTLQGVLSSSRQRVVGAPGAERIPTAKMNVTPITYQVAPVQNTKDRYSVKVWSVSLFIDATGSVVQSTWSTTSVEVVWIKHWRIAGVQGQLGPTPPAYTDNGQFSTFNDVINVISGFKAYNHAVAP